ncbi:crossover junction endodeoxyribonuclease RuvC [Xanthomonas arboricola]|uniref:crossover junction endodeoxyribonuclease RuvC n=1 Tax=Xanthomonas arboricola TaxID=56448 RepID=UPI00141AA3D1|nr:crossover junction endodeoxyribonuclease RuvC [Xanthomonas arboricola]NIK50286.1 crossover junction endodeoxyribonuclease RuvC [Xanthomonas arboricola]
MSYVIGIDPGCSGAVVVLQSAAQPLPVEWIRMPTLKVGQSTRVDAAAVARFLQDFDGSPVFIEQVHAMPKQGVSSVYTFGHAAGVVEGVVAALMLPLTLVTPQTWKKRAGLIGSEKDAARSRAIQLWPRWADLAKKGAGQAFADAALIARYGSQP